MDLLIPLTIGAGARSEPSNSDVYTYRLRITDSSSPLALFADVSGYVNSTRILNKIRDSLSKVTHYRKAEIKKTMQAVTLSLSSYDWVFDIVPAAPVQELWSNKIAYYLIPDGYGNWIRTDPRVDDSNTTSCNTTHDGNFLPTLRLLKYWNNRTHKTKLPSYYFETLAITIFKYAPQISSFPTAIKYFFDYCPMYLYSSCPDPKGLGPALDRSFDTATKGKIADALKEAATFAGYALMYEQKSNTKDAIYWWGRVFGSQVPTYGYQQH